VLDAATRLFAARGVDAVSLREVAAEANVEFALIRRYVGPREELVAAVFRDVSDRLADSVLDNPLAGQGHDPDTVMGQWVRIAASLMISGRGLPLRPDFNPVLAMADTLMTGYGLDERAARVRAAQIVASGLGWRIFEEYLVAAGGLQEVPLATLREELVHSGRRLGATPWPSPPDPPVVGPLTYLG
jgi:AcrR family transcriptional regulator